MALLRDDNVLFYHPLDSDTEYTKSFDWTRTANGVFGNGIVVSGFTQSGDLTVDIRANKAAGAYDDLENYDHFAIAFWSSGLYGGTIRDDTIEIGFGATSVDDGNGLRYFMSEAAGTPYVRLIKVGGTGPAKQILTFPSVDGWHFTVVDFSLRGSVWQYLVSINGSGWQNIGSGGNADPPDADTNCIINLAIESTSNNIILDEVVVWAGQDEFTADELSNLYELANTYDIPMNQYGDTFGTLASSGIDLFIHGHVASSGNVSLYLPSQLECKSLDIYTAGLDTSSGNMDCFISSFFVASGNSNFYTYAVGSTVASGNLYTVGPLVASGDTDEFIHGHELASGSTDFYIKGLFPTFDSFVAVVDNTQFGDISLFAHGVPFGESNTSYLNNTTTLFINNTLGEYSNLYSDWSSFTRVDDATLISLSGTWQSFVKGGNANNNHINLYINSHASGDSPHGISITDSIYTFINGLSIGSDSEAPLSNGYYYSDIETLSFVKIYDGSSDVLNFYTSGSTAIIPPSATTNLFIFGILDIIYDSTTLYVTGEELAYNTNDLFILGIQDVSSGNISLYIKVTPTGLLNQTCILYTHGF